MAKKNRSSNQIERGITMSVVDLNVVRKNHGKKKKSIIWIKLWISCQNVTWT